MTSSITSAATGAPVGTVHYLYDRDGHLIAEADAATGATTREYIWLPANDNANDTLAEAMGLVADNDNVPDLPLAVIANVNTTPITYMVHTDHLGRPTRMTDAAKATVWQAVWKPWGEAQTITGSVAQNLRFPGQYFQIETGTAYNWHRQYDPVTGRYTQPDPLGLSAGMNRYAYANNSPFMVIDRDGQNPLILVLPFLPEIGAGAAAVGGFVLDVTVGAAALTAGMLAMSNSAGGPVALQKQAEYGAYKARCEEPPPPDLGPCEALMWEVNRARDCRDMRQNWDNKYIPGRHAQAIADWDRRYQNLLSKLQDMGVEICRCTRRPL